MVNEANEVASLGPWYFKDSDESDFDPKITQEFRDLETEQDELLRAIRKAERNLDDVKRNIDFKFNDLTLLCFRKIGGL